MLFTFTPRHAVLTGAAFVAAAATLTGCTSDPAAVAPQKSQAPAGKDAPTGETGKGGKRLAPAVPTAKMLGAGWSQRDGLVDVERGLYRPCGIDLGKGSTHVRVGSYSAPKGFTVLVESALWKDAGAQRTKVAQALEGCAGTQDGAHVVTHTKIGQSGGLGTLASYSQGPARGEQGYYLVREGDVLLSVLVTAPLDTASEVTSTFARSVSDAALSAARGRAYGPVAVPNATDVLEAPQDGDVLKDAGVTSEEDGVTVTVEPGDGGMSGEDQPGVGSAWVDPGDMP